MNWNWTEITAYVMIATSFIILTGAIARQLHREYSHRR